MERNSYFKFSLIFLVFLAWMNFAEATDLTSSNFIIRDPVLGTGGGYSASGSFKFFGAGNTLGSGVNSSLNFINHYGFLYFPFVQSGVLSGSANTTTATLTWTASTASGGFNVSGYKVGKSSTSGSGYTYTNVGNVLTTQYTGQSAGTYYFVLQTLDGAGSVIATSNEVQITISVSGGNGGGGGGGGGGGSSDGGTAGVNFSGRAYPLSKVHILKDGVSVVTTIADPKANFSVNLSGLASGTYTFSVYGEDSKANKSSSFSFPLQISSGATVNIGGIFLAPTIDVDLKQVRKGDNIAIFGQSVPESEVTISVHSDQEYFQKINTDKAGAYLYNFDTVALEYGNHQTKSKSAVETEISNFGTPVAFAVGTSNIKKTAGECSNLRGDLNCDNKVNLVDFSIMAYWYKHTNPPAKVDLNSDSKISLVDFSIMAFNWTG